MDPTANFARERTFDCGVLASRFDPRREKLLIKFIAVVEMRHLQFPMHIATIFTNLNFIDKMELLRLLVT